MSWLGGDGPLIRASFDYFERLDVPCSRATLPPWRCLLLVIAPHSSWKRRLAPRALLLLLLAFVLLAIVYALTPSDNIWLQTKRELEARGEILDWDRFIPPQIPEAQNLFDHPVAANLLPVKGAPIPPNPLNVPSPSLPPKSETLGYPFTIATLKNLPRELATETNAQTNIFTLASLSTRFAQWDDSFAQLREAGQRPGVRLTGDYRNPSESPIPNFVEIRTLAQVLASRAKVHLLLGDSTAALDDLDTMSVVIRALNALPGTLVSAMIQVAVAGLYIDVVEEGLRENLWRDAELQKLIPRLTQMNLIATVQQGIRAERAGVSRLLSALADRNKDPIYAAVLRDFTSGPPNSGWSRDRAFLRLSPSGWIRRNQAHYARLLQTYIEALNPADRKVDLNKIQEANKTLDRLTARWSPHTTIVRFVTPNFSKAAVNVVRQETRARQAALACAIKRFHLQNRRYPNDLAELLPDYINSIPADLFTGQPIAYLKTSHGWELASQGVDPTTAMAAPLSFIWNGN